MFRAKRIILLLFICSFSIASAQITNVRKWRKSEVDSLDHALALYDENMFEEACPLFEGILRNHPKEEFIRYSFARCALYQSDKHEEAYLILTELYPKYNDINEMKFDIAQAALYNLRFDEAEDYLGKFMANKRISLQDKRKADALKKNIDYARYYASVPTAAKIENLGSAINSPGNEYVPTITADDSLLIFTYTGENSLGGRQNEYLQPDPKGLFMEDLYYAIKQNGQFQKAKTIDSLNTNMPDAAISLSNDGRVLYLYQDLDDGHGDIYYSEFNGVNFSKPKKMPGLNSYSWDGHCSLSPDGRTLYFSSERVGGFGGRDLYKAELLADSTWGNISNLGDSINTRFDEDAPFMHADGQNFFFSSKGRSSSGGYDIFRNTLNTADSTFGYSENLGWPINSTDDDVYFVLAADGNSGYYSSGRKGGFGLRDIYKVEPNFTNPIVPLQLVKGTVHDSAGAVSALITIKNQNTNQIYGSARAAQGSGAFLVTLPAGAKYSLTFSAKGNQNKEVLVDLTSLQSYNESAVSVKLSTLPEAPLVLAVNTVMNTNSSPTIAAAPSTSTAPVTASAAVVPAAAIAGASEATTAVAAAAKNPVTSATKDSFVPNTKFQEKTMLYVEKYGDISAPGLEFKVQFAALKSGKNYAYPELYKIGKVERLESNDGYTRLTIGGSFKTLRSAFAINKRVVKAGEKEAFVICFYKGKRTTFEELEKQKIFVEKP
jgi:hypothetical protein